MGWLPRWLLGPSPPLAPAQSRRVSTVPFKLKYGYFRELLQANDQVLEFIADLEDILAGKLVLDPPVVRSRLDKAALTTFVMVKNLNLISDGRYPGLYTALERIHGAVERELAAGDWAHHNELVVPLERAVRHARSALGGKMANLGEVKNRAGLRVPDGFVITTAAFERLLSHDGLGPSITARLRGTGDNLVRLAVASQEIQNMLRRAELPGDLRDAITGATMVLAERSGSRARFAVRSSGVGEDDARSSFAGQYETLLNVAADDVPAAYLTVVASLYQPSALLYRRERGLREEDPGMAVGVMELVDAACAGVMFSRDPARPSERRILVDAVPGQGVGAVDGTVAPDAFVLGPGNEILECSVTEKQRAQMAVPEGGLAAVELPQQDRTLPCIDATHLGELAHIARVLEDHFGGPQDIEWALDQNHKIYVLQSRPLVVREVSPVEPLEPGGGHEPLLREGTCACPGVGAGTVFRIESEADIGRGRARGSPLFPEVRARDGKSARHCHLGRGCHRPHVDPSSRVWHPRDRRSARCLHAAAGDRGHGGCVARDGLGWAGY